MGNMENNAKIDLKTSDNPMIKASLEILEVLSEQGEAYIVGGAVRDIIMGNEPHDVDISTNVSMDIIESKFRTHDIGKNKDFGIVVINHNGFIFEIAQFRSDGAYSDSRHPDSVQLGVSFEEDTKRRDFTINAIGIDKDGNVIDFHNGLADIQNKVLRTVGSASDRFEEDALRVIRAIRFASRFGYKIDTSTVEAIRNKRHLLKNISRERIKDELLKTISYGSDKFARALGYFRDLYIWNYIWGKHQIGDDVIYAIQESNSVNVAVLFSMILQKQPLTVTLDRDNIEFLRLTNDERVEIEFILKNLANYAKFKDLDKRKAFYLYDSKYFNNLRKVYTSLHLGGDVDNIETYIRYIEKFSIIKNKQKDINQIILQKGIAGKKFGILVEKINAWLYFYLDKNGTLPEDNDIVLFIESNTECLI